MSSSLAYQVEGFVLLWEEAVKMKRKTEFTSQQKKEKKKKSRAEILKQEIYRRSSDFELDFQGSIFVFFLLIP